jgi:hypothetical protein
MKNTGKFVKCCICGKEVYRQPWQLKDLSKHYCSNKCRGLGLRKINKFIELGNCLMVEVKTNNKLSSQDTYYFMLDKDDVHLLYTNKWHIKFGRSGNFYIASSYGKRLHRVIMNCPDDKIVDHINGNTLDNRKQNLRICTKLENDQNRKVRSDSTTGYKNVFYVSQIDKYKVAVRSKNKSVFGGYFPHTENGLKEAIKAAKKLNNEILPFLAI